jgi:acetyltransferase-like isoleucine patch superfamily enzyme
MKNKYIVIVIISKMIQKYRYIKYKILGYKNIHHSVILESDLNLDRVHPSGIYIGENTLIASKVTILCHEHVKRDPKNYLNPLIKETYIGNNCFIGIGCIILPGIKIGDEVIIGAGSVVTRDIPSNTIAVGNPSKIIRTNIKMDKNAHLIKL